MKLLVLPLVLCLLISSRADEPVGIRFFGGSWQELLAEAKRLNKPVFVDIYANWCPPCRRMAQEAFPHPAVGTAYNDRFINYQLNADLGEGPALIRQYAVGSYPTSLFLTPDGEVVHRAVGYGGVRAFVQQADLVLRMPKLRRSVARRRRMTADS